MPNFGGQIRCIMGDVQVVNENEIKSRGLRLQQLSLLAPSDVSSTWAFTSFLKNQVIAKHK